VLYQVALPVAWRRSRPVGRARERAGRIARERVVNCMVACCVMDIGLMCVVLVYWRLAFGWCCLVLEASSLEMSLSGKRTLDLLNVVLKYVQ